MRDDRSVTTKVCRGEEEGEGVKSERRGESFRILGRGRPGERE